MFLPHTSFFAQFQVVHGTGPKTVTPPMPIIFTVPHQFELFPLRNRVPVHPALKSYQDSRGNIRASTDFVLGGRRQCNTAINIEQKSP